MKEFFDNLRFDHPLIFRWSIGMLLMSLSFIFFMSLPPSPLLRAIGVDTVQKKIASLYYGVFWQIRAATYSSDDGMLLQTTYGSMTGLDQNGLLVISIPSGHEFMQSRVSIADVKITDLYGVAALIGGLRTEDAKFDIYPGNQVVIWIRNVPFNVKLIEAGFAVPDPNPPTSIVDKAFATYYWRIFNGSEHQ